VRKPGAFAHYRYRDDLFPTTRFRLAYDRLCQDHGPSAATGHYLQLLQLAAQRNQQEVEEVLAERLAVGQSLRAEEIEAQLPVGPSPDRHAVLLRLRVAPVDLRAYDVLLTSWPAYTEAAG